MDLAERARKLVIAPSLISGAVANPYGIVQQIERATPVSRRTFRILLLAHQGKGKLASVAVKDLLCVGFHQRLKYGKRAYISVLLGLPAMLLGRQESPYLGHRGSTFDRIHHLESFPVIRSGRIVQPVVN